MVVYFRKLMDYIERRRKLAALGEFIADYEAEHGEITEADLAERRRLDRETSIKVRGRVPDEFLDLDRRNREGWDGDRA